MTSIYRDKNFLSGAAIFILSIFLYKGSEAIPATEKLLLMRASFFPLVISIGLFICGVTLLTLPFIRKKVDLLSLPGGKDMLVLLIFIAFIYLYIYTMEFLGFILGTLLYLLLSMLLLCVKNKIQGLLLALGVTVVIYFIFVTFLKVPFPAGLLGF
ncbi:MAG: Tripartite tricarboxylate transporter TctB family [Clostridia bacterium]|nr:Tripartite tricarboxylate transporter TctB family [Clostridia bacterium]